MIAFCCALFFLSGCQSKPERTEPAPTEESNSTATSPSSSVALSKSGDLDLEFSSLADAAQWAITDQPDHYFPLSSDSAPSLEEFQEVLLEDAFRLVSEISYPTEVHLIPEYLDGDNRLWGEADRSDNREKLELAEYDLLTQKLVTHPLLEELSGQAGVGVKSVTENHVVFEIHDYLNQIVFLDYLNRETGEIKNILTLSPAPAIHISQVYSSAFGFLISTYDPNANRYVIDAFDPVTGKTTRLERENSGFPVEHQGHLFYLKVDNQSLTTQLIELNPTTREKIVRYTTTGKENYISGLYSYEGTLLLVLNSRKEAHWLTLDVAKQRFQGSWRSASCEAVECSNGLVTWSGSSRQENRFRLEYFLANPVKRTKYLNTSGHLLLSPSGLVQIHYKKADSEIPKGGMYENDSTSLFLYDYLEK